MSDTTIDVPADQVDVIRTTLDAARQALASELEQDAAAAAARPTGADADLAGRRARLADLERLLAQIDAGDGPDERRVTGSREALWDVLYDSMCAAAEQLEQACNDYWRGEVEGVLIRARIADVGTRLDWLESLGPPPQAQRGPGGA